MIGVTDGIHILFHFNILHIYIDCQKSITSSARYPGFALRYSVKSMIEGEREEDLSFCGIVMLWGNRNTRIKVLKNKIHNIFVSVLTQFVSHS